MTLKNRLTVAFLVVVLLPLFLVGVTTFFLTRYQQYYITRDFGIESDTYGYIANSVQLFSLVTQNVYENILSYAKDEPEELEGKTLLEDLNDELLGKSSFLLVKKNDDVYFSGKSEDTAKVLELLPNLWGKGSDSAGEVYIREEKLLIKGVKFRFRDGAKGRIYIITKISDLIPRLKSMITQLVVSFVIILILTGLALVSWIYRGMIAPLHQLTEATRKIAEGTLDFAIDVPGSFDEISTLCGNFEQMRERLKESADRRVEDESENRTLISNITHDLKTPVTSIKGYAEGLIDGVADTPEKREKYIRTIYNKASDMDRLINELTFYSGIDTNRIPYNYAKINLTDYFGDCVDEISLELESRGIELNYMNYLDRNAKIIADPEQLKKVINNIVGNSIKYMDKPKGVISIRLKESNSLIVVEIEDNGCGIPAKDLPFIFDRFFRSDASRNSRRGGSGIGLSIVKKIVEDHGGRVWATSHEGTGTTVLMEFRRYEEEGK